MPPKLAFAEFFAIRSPLLALDELLRWAKGGWQTATDDPCFDQAFEGARSALTARLREALSRQEVRDAFLLSSRDLGGKLAAWLRHPDPRQAEGIELALFQHLIRLATEVDCGTLQMAPGVGSIADPTSLRLGVGSRRHAQIDVAYLSALAEAAARLPSLRGELRYFNNSSLYRTGGKVRFLASHAAEAARREYRVITTELTPHLDGIVRCAEGGAHVEELVSKLMTIDPEVSQDEAESYVGELIEEQVLVPELGASLTTEHAVEDLAELLARFPEAEGVRQSLARASEAIEGLQSAGRAPQYYENFVPPFDSSVPLFRAQAFRSGATPFLSAEVVEEILRGAELLARLERPNNRIRRFTASFFTRYGDEVVPLVEALDERYGIGFDGSSTAAEPLLKGLVFSPSAEPAASWGPRERLLLRKLEEAWTSGSERISLSSEDVARISAIDASPLPNSFAVGGALSAASEAALEAGEYCFRLDSVSGPTGVAALAPFCNADPHLKDLVARHLRAEEALQPQAIFAEIVHFPHVGDPNLVVRPRLREREIPYLGRSAVDSEHRIPVTDLRLSVVAERLRLTSERLGCELMPRLTATHDFLDPKNPPIYRFLCELQNQGTVARLQWNWGALEGAAFLPRLVNGRLVLSRARWLLDAEVLQGVAASTAADRFRALCRIRERLRLPRFVEAGGGAVRSVFDLDNVLSAECLIQKLGTERRSTLVEMFPMPDALCASGPGGRYIHQLIVPFVRERNAAPAIVRAPRLDLQRSFVPGSEWLQVNLYSASAVADEVLREVVAPAIEHAVASGAVDGWYFMRYTDLELHVRLRLHGMPERLMSEVAAELRSLSATLVRDRRLWALKLDTYHREVGRYGGAEGVLAAEKIFHADSNAVLSIVKQLSDAELADARWQIAFVGIDMLLSDLGLGGAQKTEALKTARDDIAARLKADANLEAQILRRYQCELPRLRQLLGSEPNQASALEPGLSALRCRSEELKSRCAALIELERAGRLSRPIAEQAYSYIHMFANRLFPSAALGQELVLYDFLHHVHSERQLGR